MQSEITRNIIIAAIETALEKYDAMEHEMRSTPNMESKADSLKQDMKGLQRLLVDLQNNASLIEIHN